MIEFNTGLSGWFKIQKGKSLDSLETVADWQPNLITNGGMDRMGGEYSGLGYLTNYLAVGSSSTTPAFSDTALGAQVARVSYDTSAEAGGYTTAAPYYVWKRRSFQFPAGSATGVLSELGCYDQQNSVLCTHALIKDSGGSPATITVLADDILVVTYEMRAYVDTSDKTFTATIKGNKTTITVRPINLGGSWGNPNGDVGFSDYVWGGYWFSDGSGLGVSPITGAQYPPGTMQTASTLQMQRLTYVNGSYKKVMRMRLAISDLTGLTITGFMGLSSMISWQVGFSPGWLKTNSETVNLDLSTTWSRYTP